jgi:DNA-directed RNA polymerase specialized sigma24 family protein
MRDQMTSETLADMVAQGDGAAFKSLVLRHQNQVLSLCHRILGDPGVKVKGQSESLLFEDVVRELSEPVLHYLERYVGDPTEHGRRRATAA